MISINAKDTLKLKIGEQIVITTPNGTKFSYIISGFMKNSANLMREDVYGVFLTTDGFRTIYSNETDVNPSEYTMFFVLFDNIGNIPKEIADIKEQYGLSDKQVTIDFMNHTLTPLQPWTADISVMAGEHGKR